MSKVGKVSKEAKKFKEYYEVGNVWLPWIVNGLYLIRDYRVRHTIPMVELQAMFEEEKFFITVGSNDINTEEYTVGKGNEMMVCLNRNISIIPMKPLPTNAITKCFSDNCNYVQYTKRNTPVFSYVNDQSKAVELPEGLDIRNLPEESLFQTELCINNNLVHGAAVFMGLRDFGFMLCEVIYYGDSLLRIKRLFAAIEAVVIKLREKYKDK